ncbi:MAG: hypothetical protein J5582_06885 [Ruminococcus sp.]|uniref:hypothetical protein n=1 Tax=Ruminococcus sp. TaxID=41978 RepID=UPI0025D9FBF1|nr:hypothetical protein [Ruminococcus sp.]MBO4866286.1 hypothetical protein [Ruminococcus sp.]
MKDRLNDLTNSVSLSDAEKLADELSSFDDEKLTDEEQQRILSSVMKKAGFEMNNTNSVIQVKRNMTAKANNANVERSEGRIQLRRGGAVAACIAVLLAGGVIFSLNKNMHNTVPDKDRDPSTNAGFSTTDEEDHTSDGETDNYNENASEDATNMLNDANDKAKKGYDLVYLHLTDLKTIGLLTEESKHSAFVYAVQDLCDNDSPGIIGIKYEGDIDDTEDFSFHIFWRESEKSEYIGRYPDPVLDTDEHIDWDTDEEIQYTSKYSIPLEKDDENNYSPESKLKIANANAKVAFSGAYAYIDEMERIGELSSATEQEAADMAAQKLSESGIKGIVGVKFTGIDLSSPQFYVLWRSDDSDQIIGRYPYSPQSVNECTEWDCGASVYVE